MKRLNEGNNVAIADPDSHVIQKIYQRKINNSLIGSKDKDCVQTKKIMKTNMVFKKFK